MIVFEIEIFVVQDLCLVYVAGVELFRSKGIFCFRFNYSAVDIPFMFVDRSTGVYIDVFQVRPSRWKVTGRLSCNACNITIPFLWS